MTGSQGGGEARPASAAATDSRGIVVSKKDIAGLLIARPPDRPESVLQRDLGNGVLEDDPSNI